MDRRRKLNYRSYAHRNVGLTISILGGLVQEHSNGVGKGILGGREAVIRQFKRYVSWGYVKT